MTNKYNNGKIYKITSVHTVDVYIGSTTRDLKERFREHKKNYKAYLIGKYKGAVTSFLLLNHDACDITLIELINVETKKELLAREGHYIRTTPNCINKQIPGRTPEEWCIDNKDNKAIYNKKYRLENILELNAYQKKYNAEHVEEKKVYNKENHTKNKEKIALQRSEQILCACSQYYTPGHRTRHIKTLRHLKYLENIGNKEFLDSEKSKRILCECSSSYTRANKLQHFKSSKHINFINKIEIKNV